MRVKVCGITRQGDALFAAQAGADFVGLIRAQSSRRVALEAARQIVAALPAATQAVLLFRDAPLDEVFAALDATAVRCVQLHGAESVSYVRELAQRFPEMSIIRAWEVSGASAATELSEYLREAAGSNVPFRAVILDAPKGGPHPGYECLGTVARRCHKLAREVWCAAGLTPDNLVSALRAGRYEGVDVARGVERSPGIKDHAAMRRFITLAKML